MLIIQDLVSKSW